MLKSVGQDSAGSVGDIQENYSAIKVHLNFVIMAKEYERKVQS